MPWTRKQVKYLLSSGSPLSAAEKEKMKDELHADPAMGHAKKGTKKHDGGEILATETSYDHRRPKRKVYTRHARGKF